MVHCTAAGVTAESLNVKTEEGRQKLTGRFGVFQQGRLSLSFLDARGNILSDENVPGAVSPLQPVVLGADVNIPAGATGIRLSLRDTSGFVIGVLADLLNVRRI